MASYFIELTGAPLCMNHNVTLPRALAMAASGHGYGNEHRGNGNDCFLMPMPGLQSLLITMAVAIAPCVDAVSQREQLPPPGNPPL